MEKTILRWLESIGDDVVRANALTNLDQECKDVIRYSLAGAVHAAFTWEKSPQGHGYWENFCKYSIIEKPSDRSLDNSTLEERLATAEEKISMLEFKLKAADHGLTKLDTHLAVATQLLKDTYDFPADDLTAWAECNHHTEISLHPSHFERYLAFLQKQS